MFASIPNYKEFYDETDINKQGLECLRLLNEIICDFDKLLLKPKFSGIEKIKTIGSTYMLASGLSPGKEDGDGKVRLAKVQLERHSRPGFRKLRILWFALKKKGFCSARY